MLPRLLLAALTLAAATACWRVCPVGQTLPDADGGTQHCVQSTDCLRPSGVLICGNDEDKLRGCVACENTQCVRYVPETCP